MPFSWYRFLKGLWMEYRKRYRNYLNSRATHKILMKIFAEYEYWKPNFWDYGNYIYIWNETELIDGDVVRTCKRITYLFKLNGWKTDTEWDYSYGSISGSFRKDKKHSCSVSIRMNDTCELEDVVVERKEKRVTGLCAAALEELKV